MSEQQETIKLIDSHCHIPHHSYQYPPKIIIEEAVQDGVEKLVVIGGAVQENLYAIEIADSYENVYCTIAIYPHDDKHVATSELIEILTDQLDLSKKIVAVGETGIDFTEQWGGRDLKAQLELFESHMQLAEDKKLPIIIHNRNGDEHVLNILKKYPSVRGVAHSFSQDWDYAKKLLDLNINISFSGMVTYPSRKGLEETIKNVPGNRYLIETDSPFLPPQGHRGEVNYPKYVKIVAEKIAQVRGEPFYRVAADSYSNTCALFGIN